MCNRTAVPVTTIMLRIGAATYTGCGPRVELNRAVVPPEDVAWNTSQNRHDRASRKLVLMEFPLTGTKKEPRDNSVSAGSQWLQCPALETAMALVDYWRCTIRCRELLWLKLEFGTACRKCDLPVMSPVRLHPGSLNCCIHHPSRDRSMRFKPR